MAGTGLGKVQSTTDNDVWMIVFCDKPPIIKNLLSFYHMSLCLQVPVHHGDTTQSITTLIVSCVVFQPESFFPVRI